MDTANHLWESFTGSGGKGLSRKKQDEKEREEKLRKEREEKLKKENARKILAGKLRREAEERKQMEEMKLEQRRRRLEGELAEMQKNNDYEMELKGQYDIMFAAGNGNYEDPEQPRPYKNEPNSRNLFMEMDKPIIGIEGITAL